MYTECDKGRSADGGVMVIASPFCLNLPVALGVQELLHGLVLDSRSLLHAVQSLVEPAHLVP